MWSDWNLATMSPYRHGTVGTARLPSAARGAKAGQAFRRRLGEATLPRDFIRVCRALLFLVVIALSSYLCRAQVSASPHPGTNGAAPAGPADQPAPRTDANSQAAHLQLLDKAGKGGIDVYFAGDSITRRWGTSDPQYKDNLANWTANFFGWNAADFGWGGDLIQNILWRLENGELDGVNPRIIVLLAGINNVGAVPPDEAKIADITRGLKAILDLCRKKAPAATIILTAIFPRNDNLGVIPGINRINANLAQLADGKTVRYLNVNDKLADENGRLFEGMMNPGDKLHPTVKGYQVWADGLKPIFTEILGPPAKTDHAPSPTGDPSASRSAGRPFPAEQ
jgi:lysophospholipase L1-like esterase